MNPGMRGTRPKDDWEFSKELRKNLDGIDAGEITLTLLNPDKDGRPGYVGYPTYLASNGWKICVFDDCGDWDYIQWVESPEGEAMEYPVQPKSQYIIEQYNPKDLTAWGYGK